MVIIIYQQLPRQKFHSNTNTKMQKTSSITAFIFFYYVINYFVLQCKAVQHGPSDWMLAGISDGRVQREVEELNYEDALEQLLGIQPIKFKLTPKFAEFTGMDADLVRTGFIAQELLKVVPEAVRPISILFENEERNTLHLLEVRKEMLVASIVRVVVEQENRIDELNSKMKTIIEKKDKEIDELKTLVELLVNRIGTMNEIIDHLQPKTPIENQQENFLK